MSPLTYAAPLVLLLAALTTLAAGGAWTWMTMIVAFVLIPVVDQLVPGSTDNFTPEDEQARLKNPWFDRVILATAPVYLFTLVYGVGRVAAGAYQGAALAGAICTLGVCCGVFGINVAHELGHRADRRSQRAAQLLLLSTLYLHFFIEHNRGHHRRVATPDDPASARRGETVYAFWWRSITGSFASAWRLEAERLRNLGRSPWSFGNQMLVFQLVQLGALVTVGLLAGPVGLGAWLLASLGGALLLETVNYIEHYGLSRSRAEHGGWERVRPEHSWNTNRPGGRAFLFDLTRHSDHHAHATRPYAILRHHDEAPEMPFGYPAMILVALVPPLFFAILDPAVDAWRSNHPAPAAR